MKLYMRYVCVFRKKKQNKLKILRCFPKLEIYIILLVVAKWYTSKMPT